MKCKIDYRSILPSNYFKKKKHQTEKEREAGHRHGERKSKTKPPTIKERKAGHLNLRSMAPPSEPCLSLITNRQPSSIHPTLVTDPPFPHYWSLAITDRPLPHHWSTPPSSLIHKHPRPTSPITSHAPTRQVELRSWQLTTGHALSSPPKTNLVAVSEDQSLFPSISQSFSLWSLIFLLLLWWCGWWCFSGFCVVWWWVLCGQWWIFYGCWCVGAGGFSDIKFLWKLRKLLRKCKKFVGK